MNKPINELDFSNYQYEDLSDPDITYQPLKYKFPNDKELSDFIKYRVQNKLNDLWTQSGYQIYDYSVDWTQNILNLWCKNLPDW